MDMAAVMDALAGVTWTATPAPTYRHAWPASTVVPPAWVVGYPEDLDYDVSFGANYVTATFPCWFVVGKADEKSARDRLSAVISGATSIKNAIEGTATLKGGGTPVAQTTRVTSCRPTTIPVGGIELLAARFDVEVIG